MSELNLEPMRPGMLRVAYRMLGSVADAEDVVQEAWLRWLDADRAVVRAPEAYLRRVVTRLCLDQLKSARHRRETYVGPWLPEPMVEPVESTDDDDFTLPLMLALERLSPLERAAFLLHDVFGVEFEEVARTIGREPAACRQLASRARRNVHAARPRFPVSRERGMEIAEAFFRATRDGDMDGLRLLLAEDITVYADGGGKVPTAPAPIAGVAAVMELHRRLAALFVAERSRLVRFCRINGLPGFISVEQGATTQTTALLVEDGRIEAIYVIRNPEKVGKLA